MASLSFSREASASRSNTDAAALDFITLLLGAASDDEDKGAAVRLCDLRLAVVCLQKYRVEHMLGQMVDPRELTTTEHELEASPAFEAVIRADKCDTLGEFNAKVAQTVMKCMKLARNVVG